MRKPTIKKALLWTLLSLLVLIAILVAFVLTFDRNRAKPYINRRVSEAIGRVFEIRGNLALHWQKPADSPAGSTCSGWRRWVPWPRLTADDIQMSNPDWANTAPQMVRLMHVTFSLSTLPLPTKTVLLPEREADGLRR